jgi:hypothetical protein
MADSPRDRSIWSSPWGPLIALGMAILGMIWGAVQRAIEPHADAAVRGAIPWLSASVPLWVALTLAVIAGWSLILAFHVHRASRGPAAGRGEDDPPTRDSGRRPAPARIVSMLTIRGMAWRAETIDGAVQHEPLPFCPVCDMQIRLRTDDRRVFYREDLGGYWPLIVAKCDRPGCTFEATFEEEINDFRDQITRQFQADLNRSARG